MKADQRGSAGWAEKLQAGPWRDVFLVGLLILIDFAIHPLTTGPDRLIHDPAVYRLANPSYLPGDWYTEVAVKSGVYVMYAKIVNAWQWLGLPEELWRHIVYLTSLALLYYVLIRLARLFTQSVLTVPVIVLLHASLCAGSLQPIWLYGPFVQIDGGLAPRSIGVALSFLALLFLTKDWLYGAAIVLGVATLVHVSNSLITFTLFLAAWVIKTGWEYRKKLSQKTGREIAKQTAIAAGLYLLFGGWFAFYVAHQSQGLPADFSTQKFIWTWVDLRAPYLNLPLIPFRSWLRLGLHVAVMIVGYVLAQKRVNARLQGPLRLLFLIGLGSLIYFFLFYLFAFIWPWLPGFQFYSLRVIYLAYFVTYFFTALLLVGLFNKLVAKFLPLSKGQPPAFLTSLALLMIIGLTALFGSVPGWRSVGGKVDNLRDSSARLRADIAASPTSSVPKLPLGTAQYLANHPEPFLAPVGWDSSAYYLPNVASFKSFGFTPTGLAEWFARMNDLSKGALEKTYQEQQKTGQLKPVTLDWGALYSSMSKEEVLAMAERYHFRLFVTYRANTYPFTVLAEDQNYRLYQLPNPNP